MTTTARPRVWGIGKPVHAGNVQAAIDSAGEQYRRVFGRPPTHVVLPPGCDPASVNLHTLQIGRAVCPNGVVVGCEAERIEND